MRLLMDFPAVWVALLTSIGVVIAVFAALGERMPDALAITFVVVLLGVLVVSLLEIVVIVIGEIRERWLL